MLICAIAVVPVIYASQTDNLWVAVGLIAIAAAAHQGWSANIFTTASDMFPKQAIGSIVGIGGMMGAVGGMIFQSSTGYILQHNNSNYIPVFVVCGSVYLVALLIMHLLLPRWSRQRSIDADHFSKRIQSISAEPASLDLPGRVKRNRSLRRSNVPREL